MEIGSVRRVLVHGLQEGNQKADANSETEESAAGRAIVIVPKSVVPPPKKGDPWKVDVLLHLHGQNIGYRLRAKQDEDMPNDVSFARGTVRDVTVDRFEDQLGALAESGRPIIGVLPQGTYGPKEKFGAKGLNSTVLINEALDKVKEKLGWSTAPKPGNVVFSAHSGGGGTVIDMLSQKKGSLPVGMNALVLFDAIRQTKDSPRLDQMKGWVRERMAGDLRELKKNPHHLETSLRLRAIYSPGYAQWYEPLRREIDNWLKEQKLPEGIEKKLRENYVVKPASPGSNHPHVVGHGNNLQNVLQELFQDPPPNKPAK